MSRPSRYGEPEPGHVTKPKDPYRGIDPERLDRFSSSVDRTMGEMFALGIDDKPIRGANLAQLASLARTLQLQVAGFVEDVEAAT